MLDVPHIDHPLFAPAGHQPDEILDLHPVVHVQPVGLELGVQVLHRGVHKQQRNPLAAQHLGVFVVKHLKADDPRRPLFVKGGGQGAGLQLGGGNAVDGHAVVEMVNLGLEPVQHHGGKMGVAEEPGGEHGDFPLAAGGLGLFGFLLEQGQIGNLLVPHFGRLAENPFPGGICQGAGVVDGLGHRVAGKLQLVGDVLDRHLAGHDKSLLYIL